MELLLELGQLLVGEVSSPGVVEELAGRAEEGRADSWTPVPVVLEGRGRLGTFNK